MDAVVKALQSLKSKIYHQYQQRKQTLKGNGYCLAHDGMSADLIYKKAYREGYMAGVDDSMETFVSSVSEEEEGEIPMNMIFH